MKLRIIEENPDFISVEVTDVDQSVVNLVTETLNTMDGVLYAGYRLEHPLTGKMTVSVKVDPAKTSPRKSLLDVLHNLDQMFELFDEQLKILR
ncbi:MAG: hypothetical protein NZ941_01080 [Candidatus Caldarchaeum sp.]|nr:hypothetical protein [Candidatus Caldarchaeum sp.]